MSRPAAMAAPVVDKATGPHVVARSDSAAERQAERWADTTPVPAAGPAGWAFGRLPVHPAMPGGPGGSGEPGDPVVDVRLDGPGHRLDPAVQAELGGLGADLDAVRLHTGADADDTARRAGADALTVGAHIVFARGKYDPHGTEGRRRIAHELAHVAQHALAPGRVVALRDGQGAVAPATTLLGLPEADRRRIQSVTTTTVSVTGLEEKFSVQGAAMRLGLPSGTTVVLDASVDARLQRGMSNVAAALTTEADVSPAPMPENSTVTLALDLTRYGAIKGLYRFTFHAPPAAAGAKGAPAKRILVEQLGASVPVPGAARPRAAEPGRPAPADPVAEKIKAAGIKHSFPGDRLEALRAALADVPASHLAIVKGLTFRTAPDDPAKPDTAGDYDPDTHTVTMYEKAFRSSDSTFEKGRVATSFASRAIVHEIGHAVDLAGLRAARATRKAANEAVNAAAGTFTSKEQKDRYDAAVAAAAEAKRVLLRTTSRSGSTTATKKGQAEPVDVIGTAAKGAPFREAAAKDGRAVSRYKEKDWQERYAEAYALYLTSPETLKALRPATYDYLDKNLPK